MFIDDLYFCLYLDKHSFKLCNYHDDRVLSLQYYRKFTHVRIVE